MPGELPTRWRTKDGRDLAIVEMGEQHLRNTIAMLERVITARRKRWLLSILVLGIGRSELSDAACDALDEELDALGERAQAATERDRTAISAMRVELDRRGVPLVAEGEHG